MEHIPHPNQIRERSLHLAEHLRDTPYDVVGLQEIFQEWHANLIREQCKEEYPYGHWFRSGLSGSPGLLFLSRWPIVDVEFRAYTLGGYPQNLNEGDWLAGKGVGRVRVQHSESLVDVYNTHTLANYHSDDIEMDPNKGHRLSQHYEIAKFVTQSRGVVPVVVMGDFNTQEQELGTKVFMEITQMSDSFRDLYPNEERYPGFTNDTPECCWRYSPQEKKRRAKQTKRIDYVYYDKSSLECISSRTCCGSIPGKDYAYSDHLGVHSTFHVTRPVKRDCHVLTGILARDSVTCVRRSMERTHSEVRRKLLLVGLLIGLWLVVLMGGNTGIIGVLPTVLLSNGIVVCVAMVTGYLIFFCKSELSKFAEFEAEFTYLEDMSCRT